MTIKGLRPMSLNKRPRGGGTRVPLKDLKEKNHKIIRKIWGIEITL
jgi:hypothetical protein